MSALQEMMKKEKLTDLEFVILNYSYGDGRHSIYAEAAASELAALRKELEEAKAENKYLKALVGEYIKWVSLRTLESR